MQVFMVMDATAGTASSLATQRKDEQIDTHK